MDYWIALRLTLSRTGVSSVALNFLNNISAHTVNYNHQMFTSDRIRAKSWAIVYEMESSGEFSVSHRRNNIKKALNDCLAPFLKVLSASVNDLLYVINHFESLRTFQNET